MDKIKGESNPAIQATNPVTNSRSAFGFVAYFISSFYSSPAKTVFIIPADVNSSIFPWFER